MNNLSILYVVLSSIPMFVCAFWAVTFIVGYRHLQKSKKILCFFMCVATSLYFGHFIIFNHLYDWVPVTDTIYSLATLSVYPIFLIYIKSITEKLHRRDLWMLVPGAVIGGTIGICYVLMPCDELQRFILECHYQEKSASPCLCAHVSLIAHRLMKPVIAIQVILVLVLGFRKLWMFKRKVEQFYSNTEQRDLHEVHHLLLFFLFTACFSVIANQTGRAYFVDSIVMMTLILTPFAVLIYAIGYVGYNQTYTIENLIEETEEEVPVAAETDGCVVDADLEFRHRLLNDIDALMETEHLFLNENLKLSDLAEKLNTNRTYIYEAMKLAEKRGIHSFSEYVNRYRIEFSKQLMVLHPEKCMIEIQVESGFASKTAFYTNFKKLVGMTPSAFIKQQCKFEKVGPEHEVDTADGKQTMD